MDAQSVLTAKDVITHMVTDIARCIGQRLGDSQKQHFERTQAVVHMVMAFQPMDPVEAMLAGHCVIFHEMIVDTVQTAFLGQQPADRQATRSAVVAMDKAFGNNLIRLEHHRKSRAQAASKAPEAPEIPARDEPEIADRVHRHQSQRPAAGTVLRYPAPEQNPAVRANQEAADPLAAADPETSRRSRLAVPTESL